MNVRELKTNFLIFSIAVMCIFAATANSQSLLLNEVEGDAPDATTQFSCQYVELRGTPGATVPAGRYFASINGASGSFGDLSFIVDLSGQTFGSNGTISIINELEGTCPNRTFPPGTTLISVQDFDGLGLIDGGARTFAVLSSPNPLNPGDDLDLDNNRVIDPANGVTVIDGFGFTTNVIFQATYAPNLFDAATQGAPGTIFLPDAATRFSGNTTPLTAAAWYFGELAASPAETTAYSGTPQSANFPVGGVLTPGLQNLPAPPLAAVVNVGGRVMTSSGNGIRNAIVSLTSLNGEMRFVRTSSFGYYNFTDVPVGETYILSIVSKRYTFSQATLPIEVLEQISDANFVAVDLNDFNFKLNEIASK